MIDKLERKLGKYAINNLMIYLIGGYFIGYILYFGYRFAGFSLLDYLSLEPYYIIHNFQIWRLVTWVIIPPNTSILWAVIMMILYYQLGSALERSWGAFRFNLFIFGGLLCTIIGAFILYGILVVNGYSGLFAETFLSNPFSTYYINMSIFLAFAVCYPDMQVLLYFIIPIKMKWMAIFYVVMIAISMLSAGWATRVVIISSLLNVLIFYLIRLKSGTISFEQRKRQAEFRRTMNGAASGFTADRSDNRNSETASGFAKPGFNKGPGVGGVSRHRCAVCGRTELTNPGLEFRFCSKCNGNYEYCQDHLFTHEHKR